MATLRQLTLEVQRQYPRIYLACHIDHAARRGQGPAISARDQTILAHIGAAGLRPRELAAHLAVGASTLSAALKRLVGLGLVVMAPTAHDARGRIVRLTVAGQRAISRTSVLESARVRGALARLPDADRALVVRGLTLLADAAHQARKET
jgi:DNA-binding MarR family transcriptional regulator